MSTISARVDQQFTSRVSGERNTFAPLRLAERCGALLAFGVCTPILVPVAIAIRILSGRPPLVAHRRVGMRGTEFYMLKLRTMWGAESLDENRFVAFGGLIELLSNTPVPKWKKNRDERVTSRFARLLRKFSLDELPQLLHVASGEMALIGPRPVTRSELETYYGPQYDEVLSVRPGMTGLWQVLGRNRLTYSQRRRLDIFFVHNRTPRLYWMILLRTPGRLFGGRDAF